MCALDPAERARTAVETAAHVGVGAAGQPLATAAAHAVDADGDLLVAVPARGGPALHAALPDQATAEFPARAVATDLSPVAVPDRVRATVTLRGYLSALLGADRQRAAALLHSRYDHAGGSAPTWSDEMILLRLEPAEVDLADGCLCADRCAGTGPVDIDLADFLDAVPDPLTPVEARWLGHLAVDHDRELAALAVLAQPQLRAEPIAVRPMAIDRAGLRLRIKAGSRTFDVRLPFPRVVGCPCEANKAINALFAGAARPVR